MLVSAFVVIFNETVMTVALPTLLRDLSITESQGQWLTTAFLLTTAIVIPVTGWLLQRYPTKGVFIAAMVLFSAGTLLAALAPGFWVLVAARVVQASGTAIMMPLLFTTVLELVPEHRRGRIMGNVSTVISVAPALGPTVSGVILQWLDWRWVFLIVLPFALAALILGAIRIPTVNEPRRVPLDSLSVVISALGFGGLVYGLSAIGPAASGLAASWTAWGPLVVAALALAAFVWRQLHLQKSDAALLDLRVFRSRTFSAAMVIGIVGMMSLFGTLTLLPLYLRAVLAEPSLAIGLAVLPGGLVMGLLSPVIGRVYDRVGPRPIMLVASIVVSAALWAMTALLGDTSPLALVIVLHIALSAGLAMLFTPLFTAGLGAVPAHLYSHGSAVLGAVQQVAGAAGVAVFVTVLAAFAGDTSHGVTDVPAYAAGVHAAFAIGAVISLALIPLVLLVRRAPSAPAPGIAVVPEA